MSGIGLLPENRYRFSRVDPVGVGVVWGGGGCVRVGGGAWGWGDPNYDFLMPTLLLPTTSSDSTCHVYSLALTELPRASCLLRHTYGEMALPMMGETPIESAYLTDMLNVQTCLCPRMRFASL